jgi:hypothetical protein
LPDVFFDLVWVISKSSGIIQLRYKPYLSELYVEQTTTSAVGEVWKQHHQDFAASIARFSPKCGLEIGVAH